MKLLLLATLVAVALAGFESDSWELDLFPSEYELKENSFRQDREFIFQYNGQVATGIPGSSSQHAATQIQAKISLVFQQDSQVLMNIRRIRIGKLNQEIYNPRAMIPFMSFESVEITNKQQKQLYLPVQFQYKQGIISEIIFDGQEVAWSSNIKRGILNMLQVNLAKRNQVDLQEEHVLGDIHLQQTRQNQKMDYFTALEKTLEGECKTHYTIVSEQSRRQEQQQGQVLNVTRSIDFEQCQRQRPEMKYNFRFQDPCTRCDERLLQDDEKFLRSSSITRYNISGTVEDFVIESAVLESQYQVVPFNNQGNVISTYVNQTLQLKYSGPIQNENQIRQPSNQQQSESGLVYNLDWDIQKEQFIMQGQDSPFAPFAQISSQKLQQLLRPLIANIREDVKAEVPEMYLNLVQFLAQANKGQVKQLLQQFLHEQPESFSQEEHLKIKILLIDALADAGTRDSISLLLQLIKEKQITPLRASLVLKQLINIPLPSQEIVREYQQFLQHEIVQQNWILKQSAYLTLGSLVQGVCMPSEDKLAILPRGSQVLPQRRQPNTRLCPQELQQQILNKLLNEFEQQDQEEGYENQVLIMKTIGNMGLPLSVQRLEKIIKEIEQQQNLLVRIEAVNAFRQLREALPKTVNRVLMPIFMNSQQPNQLRMAAVYQIFQTMPERPILDQIARKLFSERSEQVASFVYSYMYTVANTTNPCEKSFGRDLQLSLRHGRQIAGAFQPQYSKFLHTTYYSQKFLTGMDVSFGSIISNRTFVPQAAQLNFHSRFLGLWAKYFFTMGFAQQNVESLVHKFLRRTEFSDINLDDILRNSPRAQTAPLKELKQLWKQLETVARQLPSASPKGYMYLKLKDQEFFMMPISQKTMKQLPSLKEIKRTFVQGKHIHIQKAALLHSISYKIPTAIGMPLRVAVWVPSVTQLQGQIRIETQNPFKLMVNNLKPSVAVQVMSRVEMWNPFASTGVQIKAKAKVYAPLTAKFALDTKARMPSIKMGLEVAQKEIEYLKLETVPTTYVKRNIASDSSIAKARQVTILGEQWNRMYNARDMPRLVQVEKLLKQVVGIPVRAEGLWHHTQIDGPTYLPVCPFSGPNHLRLIREQPTAQSPKELVMKVTFQNLQPTETNIEAETIQFSSYDEEEQFESAQIKPAKGIQAQVKTELYTKGGEQERRAQMETQVKCTSLLRLCKLNSQVTVQPVPQLNRRQVKLCLNAQTQLPQPALKFQQLQGKQAFAQLKATWGQEQCQQENIVEIKVNAQHSQQQVQYRQEQSEYRWFSQEKNCQQYPEMCSEVEMENVLSQQQQLLKYNLYARYQNIPVGLKNVTNKAFQMLKSQYYWNTDSMNFMVRNPQNVIRAQLTLDPKTKQFFNMTIKTPIENVTVTDATLPMPAVYPVHIRQPYAIRNLGDVLENVISPVVQQCLVNGQRVQTFDEVLYRAPLSTCWTLLAKDCQDEANPSYAVLMKKATQTSSEKLVKIITYKHKIFLARREEQEQILIKVDGQQLQQESELPYGQHLRIEKYGQQQVIVTLPESGVKVIYDGWTAKIQMSPMMQSQQCGLCGHYNQEQNDEFYTPQNERVQDIRQFIQSYTTKSNNCEYPEELEQISKSQDLRYEQEPYEFDFDFSESQNSQEESIEVEDQSVSYSAWDPLNIKRKFRHIVREEEESICATMESYPKCPPGSYPNRRQSQKTEVEFHCISKFHPLAYELQHVARYEDNLPERILEILGDSQETYSRGYKFPRTCRLHK